MLKREGDGIFNPLDGNCQRISRETFADDNLDPADLVCGAPVTLAEKFASKGGEFQGFEVTIFGKIF